MNWRGNVHCETPETYYGHFSSPKEIEFREQEIEVAADFSSRWRMRSANSTTTPNVSRLAKGEKFFFVWTTHRGYRFGLAANARLYLDHLIDTRVDWTLYLFCEMIKRNESSRVLTVTCRTGMEFVDCSLPVAGEMCPEGSLRAFLILEDQRHLSADRVPGENRSMDGRYRRDLLKERIEPLSWLLC